MPLSLPSPPGAGTNSGNSGPGGTGPVMRFIAKTIAVVLVIGFFAVLLIMLPLLLLGGLLLALVGYFWLKYKMAKLQKAVGATQPPRRKGQIIDVEAVEVTPERSAEKQPD
jgi:hypothetical protein